MNGTLIVISGYSGVGKGTVIPLVLKKLKNTKKTVSCTTREKRDGEKNGVNYYFITEDEFKEKIANNEFLEYTQTYTNYYGTLKSEIDDNLANGKNMILELNVVGALRIKELYEDCLTIFIQPPSLGDLRKRLIGRGTESAESLGKRLAEIEFERSQLHLYDFVVTNDEPERCANEMIEIINDNIEEE